MMVGQVAWKDDEGVKEFNPKPGLSPTWTFPKDLCILSCYTSLL